MTKGRVEEECEREGIKCRDVCVHDGVKIIKNELLYEKKCNNVGRGLK